MGNEISVNLSISHSAKGPESCLNYNGSQKVKEDCVEDSHSGIHAQRVVDFLEGNGTDSVPVDQCYNKEIERVALMGHAYGGHSQIRSIVV